VVRKWLFYGILKFEHSSGGYMGNSLGIDALTDTKKREFLMLSRK